MKYNSYINNVFMWWKVGLLTSEHALNNQKVKNLIRSKSKKFDLVIMEQFFHESFLMFGHKFQAPIVTLGTFGYADNMDRSMGIMTPWSFVPHIALPYKDRMNFWERCHNVFVSVVDLIGRRWYYLPEQQKLAEKYFKDVPGPLPSLLKLERNVSLMLINSHISIDAPRPRMPGLVDVGGIHIKPTKPLPKNIKDFLDGAKHGAIYFSLGSYVRSNQMPKKKVKMILEAFRQLPQRVLWKYEDSSIGPLPENIMISEWMPQNDILAHKNLKLFITHGGIFGTQEGIFHGVPFLFMPLFADQHRNTLKSVNDGLGQSINFADLTTELLLDRIRKVISNKTYSENMKRASLVFRDNLVPPMEEAMYRIEYVIRHKGAPHTKSASVNLQWYEYFLLDVFGSYLSLAIVPIYIILKFISLIMNGLSRKKEQNLFKKKIS